MNSRIEEQITSIEYARVMHRLRNTTDQNEKIQMENVARWLRKKLDNYRRQNGSGVQDTKKANNIGKVSSNVCLVRQTDNQR